MWGKITYPLPKVNGATIEVPEWISNYILHFAVHVITYPCRDESQSMLVKWLPGIHACYEPTPDPS